MATRHVSASAKLGTRWTFGRQTMVLLMVLSGVLPASSRATTRYVGTQQGDYSTIALALAAWQSPDTIIVRAGTYREQVNLDSTKSVTSPARAVLKTDGGIVKIDCTDPFNTTQQWTQHTGNVWYTTTTITVPDGQVFVDDQRYTYVSGSAYGSLTSGQYGYDAPTTRVYVNVGGGNPGNHATFISKRTRGINLTNADNWTIDGFTVMRGKSANIDLNGRIGRALSGLIVQNCTAQECWGQGIRIDWGNRMPHPIQHLPYER